MTAFLHARLWVPGEPEPDLVGDLHAPGGVLGWSSGRPQAGQSIPALGGLLLELSSEQRRAAGASCPRGEGRGGEGVSALSCSAGADPRPSFLSLPHFALMAHRWPPVLSCVTCLPLERSLWFMLKLNPASRSVSGLCRGARALALSPGPPPLTPGTAFCCFSTG